MCASLLISISVSLITLSGFGSTTLLHSSRSVTLLLPSSYRFSSGSYTCLILDSSSFLCISFSSVSFSLSSAPSSSLNSILIKLNAFSISLLIVSSSSLIGMENLGFLFKIISSSLVSSMSPILCTLASFFSSLSYFSALKALKLFIPSIPGGISVSSSSPSLSLYLFSRCSILYLYFCVCSLLSFSASCFRYFIVFL